MPARKITIKRVHLTLLALGRPELHVHILNELQALKNHPLDLDITPELVAQNLLWRYPGCPRKFVPENGNRPCYPNGDLKD